MFTYILSKHGGIDRLDITRISQANSTEITEMLDAVLRRYNELFPQWETTLISTEKCRDTNEQINRAIDVLQKLKT